jgi:Protein of unknown function (DUF3134)
MTDIKVYNPSLREEPRDKPADVLLVHREIPLLEWLEKTGRLRARQPGDFDYADDQEEINDLMGNNDDYDDDDDDDDVGDVED